jgi:two-component system CheB/CheR fusion protein
MAADAELEGLLAYLERSRGFDFGAYKRVGLMRRMRKRLEAVGAAGFAEYLDYLEVHPEEFQELFDTILINVTGFFRDPLTWEYVTEEVLPAIARKPDDQPIRVWSCGCASGEEAYTLAMLLAEELGKKAYRDRVKIYATDADDRALEEARQATYTAKQVEAVPEPLVSKYFERGPRGFLFDKDLRRSVIFGRNNLIHDAPISRIDLLVCRNTLMYFNAEAQNRILSRFHFALQDDGYLVLGKAELLLTHSHLFAPVDLKRRVFSKVVVSPRRERPPTQIADAHWDGHGDGHGDGNGAGGNTRLRQASFAASPTGEVLLDARGRVVEVNDVARTVLGLEVHDGGLGLEAADIANRLPGVRAALELAQSETRAISLRGIESGNGSEPVLLDVHVVPLMDGAGVSGVSIFLSDASRVKRLQEELTNSRGELEAVSEELESTNEELETTNEELQSANEELETTNEELQSTNEELETMNEELQSTNEELHNVNDEVRKRSEALDESNTFLASILTGLRSGVIVLDTQLQVIQWNRRAEDLWGLRAEEVRGKHLLNLDIGLPVDELKPAIRACLTGGEESREVTVVATNRRGRTIDCEVIVTPLGQAEPGIRGVILLMQER